MLYFSRWKTISILLVVLAGLLYAAPNLLSPDTRKEIPTWLPNRAMTLGLDLQGGSHILLQVDRAQLQAEKLETLQDDIRRILREARIGYRFAKSGDNAVNITLVQADEIATAKDKLSELTAPVQGGLFGQGSITEVEMSEPSDGVIRMTLTEQGIRNALSHALTQSVEVVSRRVNELGTTEPIIQRHGDDRILVQVPGLQDPQRLKDLLGQTAKLTFHLVSTEMSAQEALTGRPPVGTKVLYEESDPPTPYLVESRAMVEGENLVAAQVGTDAQTNEPVVSFRFDTKGATRFCQVTSANVGRPFAIVLDDHVISAPVIRDAICGGSGQISGNFSFESANDLAVLLRAGALPADLNIVEERTVGPSLGADSITAGQVASMIAAVLVVAFMLAAYGTLGVIANIALAANVAMIVAILSVLGATLTLPGIAGIVLTIGMAVDSNVIIFERVREERRQGRSIVQSLDSGFKQATSTIIDANLTTFIAAAILFWLGSGPVKGFAVTLAIGLVTTVFTAFTFTRWMIALWLRRNRPTEMPKGLVNYIPFDTRIPFMRYRNYAFAASLIASLATVALFGFMNMNLGVDFRGGALIEVQAKSGNADIADVRNRLQDLNLGEIQVQEFGSPRDLLIRVGSQEAGDSADQSGAVLVSQSLQSDYELRRVEVVGPTVSAELTRNGIIGVTVAMVAMMIYIWLRFEWQFGIGAIVSTLHDVIMIMGFYILSGIEFNLTSIAAVLTIVGYSINDTVVVYDRMRENLRKYKKMPISELIDMSLNQTLSRTILTGATTLLALIVLYLFGGEVISSFTIAMIVGIVIGTYSSVFVAGPLLILFKLRPGVNEGEGSAADKAIGAGTPSGA